MAAFEIVWTDNALLRFQNILGYYLERNQTNSYPLKLQAEVDRVLQIVESYPKSGRLAKNGKTRIVMVDRYELLYEIVKQDIIVVDFWDPRQHPYRRKDLME